MRAPASGEGAVSRNTRGRPSVKKGEARHRLSLVRGAAAATADGLIRDDGGGLFSDEYAFPGTQVINGYLADKTRLFRWEGREGVFDGELHNAFEALLVRHTPKPRLA